jgi:predicted RND superfamily exporter protein
MVKNDGDPMGEKTVKDAGGFTQELLDSGEVSKVISLYTVMDSIKSEVPSSVTINAAAVSGLPVYKEMVSDEYSKIIIFPADLDNATIETIINVSNEYEDIIIAGTQLTMYELNQQMIKGQVNSLLIAFGIVLLSLIISMRKLWLSLLAMLPILLTTLFLFAFLGLSGISLNLFTTTIFSITIGVGIDYAIHFTSVYNKYKSSGLSNAEAVDKAYSFSARPITANALGFSLGLTALMLSPLKVHLYVSLLMWVSMVLSSVLSLSFLPSLLKSGKKKQRIKKA